MKPIQFSTMANPKLNSPYIISQKKHTIIFLFLLYFPFLLYIFFLHSTFSLPFLSSLAILQLIFSNFTWFSSKETDFDFDLSQRVPCKERAFNFYSSNPIKLTAHAQGCLLVWPAERNRYNRKMAGILGQVSIKFHFNQISTKSCLKSMKWAETLWNWPRIPSQRMLLQLKRSLVETGC